MRLDPIVIREHRAILDRRSSTLANGVKAADALLWLCEHANDGPATRVLTIRAGPVASATPNADIAARYIQEAALSFAEAILERAGEMAKSDFDDAKRGSDGPAA